MPGHFGGGAVSRMTAQNRWVWALPSGVRGQRPGLSCLTAGPWAARLGAGKLTRGAKQERLVLSITLTVQP